MATEQQTESGIVEPPARPLRTVRDDLHTLEKELVHHLKYATWERKAERSGDISDAIVAIRNARRWLGALDLQDDENRR